MSFFADIKADGLIEEIRSVGDLTLPNAQKVLAKLAKLGPGVIPKIIGAFTTANKQETEAYVAIMAPWVDKKTLPQIVALLETCDARTAAAIGAVLASSNNYAPSVLLDLLNRPNIPKPVILNAIAAQKKRINIRDVLHHAYLQEANEKAALFRILGDMADENTLPELLSRIEGKDTVARIHIIHILSRFDRPEVSLALQKQLHDPNKLIRHAALDALSVMRSPVEIELVCKLLCDGDIAVQNKAVELIVRARDPNTMHYLVPVLKDENEYTRRAGVEVLNELATSKDIKHLLNVIKDDDWWVRSRAADALGKIGGPRVVDAVLELIRDKDEEVRRAAIEILNQTKDERAVDGLVNATKDKDWWVAERAIDALAAIGSKKAVPALLELIEVNNVRSLPVAARALGQLGDARAIKPLLALLNRAEREIKIEAIQALAHLADDRHADDIRNSVLAVSTTTDDATVIHAVTNAIDEIDSRFSSTLNLTRALASKPTLPAKTLLVEKADIATIVKTVEEDTHRLDISTLQPGDIIEGRYKFIERIGKGAFGTVLLVEDAVVEERLILKFLNPNISQDEEMMKRFVHELRYSRKITHPNVIRIYDFIYIRGNYAISMEYFPSHPLSAEIVNDQPLPVALAVRFACDIATGMAAAHTAGIVHRDLKPANILINDEKLLKIVDFGVAAAHKEGDTQLTKTGYVIGSPKYMAPEQILGKKVDERADIYSLGVIMYEMLTGMPPYSRGDHMSVMYQHVQGKAKPPCEVNLDLPIELSEIIVKAFTVDKQKRYNTMDELRMALEPFLK